MTDPIFKEAVKLADLEFKELRDRVTKLEENLIELLKLVNRLAEVIKVK